MTEVQEKIEIERVPLVRLDLGCGNNKKKAEEGEDEWVGVDSIKFDAVDVVADLCKPVYEWQYHNVIAVPGDDERSEYAPSQAVAIEKAHIGYEPWPWEDNSVDEIHCAHFIEHFGGWDRVHIFNEMYRVLKPGGKATVITPSWTSARAYGDPTHAWPPIGVYTYFYLDKNWRMGGLMNGQMCPANAPHTDASNVPLGFKCDFPFVAPGGSLHPETNNWNADKVSHYTTFMIEAVQDMCATLIKRT